MKPRDSLRDSPERLIFIASFLRTNMRFYSGMTIDEICYCLIYHEDFILKEMEESIGFLIDDQELPS